MIIKTNSGEIKGLYQDQLYQFRGIPYAFAKRFQKPTITHWQECLDCTYYRDKAPQNETNNPHYIHQSEDCLNLNIYTPTLNKSLPVLVEFHGGAFQKGHNQKMNPLHVIGQDEFIYITINYRLGILGYLYLGNELGEEYRTSGNNGLLDQIAALQWIHENIHYFGGDPHKVTLLGSSAGAKSIAALMSIPHMNQYFQQAILMSGAYQSIRDIHTAQAITNKFKKYISIPDLLENDFQYILNIQHKVCSREVSTCYFGPVCDNIVIPSDYMEHLKSNQWNGRAIIGSSLHELSFYQSHTNIDQLFYELFGINANQIMKQYQSLCLTLKPSDALIKVLSDYMYRTYSYYFCDILSKKNPYIYQYSSQYPPAFHCLDHLLAFLPTSSIPQSIYTKESLKLGQSIRENMISFVINGHPKNPNWLPVHQSHSQMIWNQISSIEKISIQDVCPLFNHQIFHL